MVPEELRPRILRATRIGLALRADSGLVVIPSIPTLSLPGRAVRLMKTPPFELIEPRTAEARRVVHVHALRHRALGAGSAYKRERHE